MLFPVSDSYKPGGQDIQVLIIEPQSSNNKAYCSLFVVVAAISGGKHPRFPGVLNAWFISKRKNDPGGKK